MVHRRKSVVGLRVLVVEDQPDFGSLLSSIFADEGYVVDAAADGTAAIERVRNHRPDVITLDLRMPEMGGVQFFRKVREDPEFSEIPLVIVTGIARDDPEMDEMVSYFLEDEHLPMPDAYLEKPFENEELLRVVHDALWNEPYDQAVG
jgi:CheY-like chemotaxis protein